MMPAPPAPAGGRIATIDGLRGLAVMGILLMNVTGFALPEGAYYNPAAYGSRGALDYLVWAANFLLADGKFRNLFSLLFGASMLLIAERARAAGESAAAVHYRRMLTLALFGATHFYLIWWGDILLHYAIVGCIAFLLIDKPADVLVRLGIACFVAQLLVSLLLLSGLYQLQAAAAAPGATAETVKAWLDARAQLGVSTPDRLAAEIALFRGSWSGFVHLMLGEKANLPLVLLLTGGAETLGLMLFGMAAYRSGFLTGAWPRAAYWRVAAWGYGAGLGGTAAMLAIAIGSGFDSLAVFGVAMAGGVPFRPLLMAGHAALAILWLTGGTSPLRARVIAAGQAAFTNYLGTSIAMTALFYGWGLGLFAELSRAALYPIVLAVWAVMLLWSRPWLRRFRYGPLEWLWRSLARGRPQPLRRRSGA